MQVPQRGDDFLRVAGHADLFRALDELAARVASLAALAWAYEKTGDAARRRQACRQLVARSEEIGVAADAEEVLAARQVLATSA